jgi:phosphoglucomutase
MAPGFSCMNEVTVMQASQGLARWLKSEHSDICSLGVVLGHDARHNSDRFAELAANAFQALDIPVYFFTELSATPLVSYSIKHYKTAGGVMVTASHVSRPKWNNGSPQALTNFSLERTQL